MAESQVVYEGRKFTVRRQQVPGRDGVPRTFDFVAHTGAAVILPLLEDGRIVFIQNVRPATGGDLIELPAGTIDPPETALDCARREVREETGYSATELRPLARFYSSPGICNELMHAFLATGLTAGQTAHEPMEIIQVRLLTLEDALRGVRDGRIMDGKTIVTLLYYDRFARPKD